MANHAGGPARTQELDVGRVSLATTLAPLAMLAGDPTVRLGAGTFARATWTPDGPAVVTARWEPGVPTATATVTGPGADRLVPGLPGLLGLADDVTGFAPPDGPVRELWRRHAGDRVPRTGTLWHDLAWTVVQQRISRVEAARQWRALVSAAGTPLEGSGLVAPPSPEAVARLDLSTLHRLGFERRRAETLVTAARLLVRRPDLGEQDAATALPVLTSVPGIGPWTAACLRAFTYGDADTVLVGDAGIPGMVAWLLAREPRADDARMLELLEPYRPHRYRIVKLAFAARAFPPARPARGRGADIRRL